MAEDVSSCVSCVSIYFMESLRTAYWIGEYGSANSLSVFAEDEADSAGLKTVDLLFVASADLYKLLQTIKLSSDQLLAVVAGENVVKDLSQIPLDLKIFRFCSIDMSQESVERLKKGAAQWLKEYRSKSGLLQKMKAREFVSWSRPKRIGNWLFKRERKTLISPKKSLNCKSVD